MSDIVMVRYCPQCEAENVKKASVCLKCGFDLSTVRAVFRRTQQEVPTAQQIDEPAREGDNVGTRRVDSVCILESLDDPALRFGILDGLTVGRTCASDVVLTGTHDLDCISSRHARFFRRADQWYVQHVGTTNFIKVDGVKYRGDDEVAIYNNYIVFLALTGFRVILEEDQVIIQAVGSSNIGNVREANQDFYCIGPLVDQSSMTAVHLTTDSRTFQEHGFLAAVADGMGGYQGGELASRTILDALSALFFENKNTGLTAEELAVRLTDYFEQTQQLLEGVLRRTPEFKDAGTTLAGIALLPPDLVAVFHVGDSRVLRASAGYARALTVDHTAVGADLAGGNITEEQAIAAGASVGGLTRSLGIVGNTEVQISVESKWESGDTYLIGSDGWHGLGRGLSSSDIHDVLAQNSTPETIATRMIEEAVRCDGQDNATVVVVSIFDNP